MTYITHLKRNRDLLNCVNEPMPVHEEQQIRQSVNRGTPFGSPVWVERVAGQLGLEASLRVVGRPWKPEEI